MKKLTVIILSLLLLLALSACSNNNFDSYISRENAIENALNHIGASRKDVFDLEADFDKDLNQPIWEVDFEHDGHEYSYDIDAVSGEVLKIEREAWD